MHKQKEGEREKVTKSLWAFFLPHLGRTFPFREPLIWRWGRRIETVQVRKEHKGLKKISKRSKRGWKLISVFRTRSYYCFAKWLTICSNLDKYALKLHSDDRDAASSVENFFFINLLSPRVFSFFLVKLRVVLLEHICPCLCSH